ncbi:DEAD/DEAH box helicase [Mechercharimyces sp. CAU 1602]|uniref:DEAD/DEAH box helicase n=1 Tax=Mechercharimyces sp. CAU 1602 TaxID=2973933 RepID=UPI0021636E27|nr:DEAD/DEAH box helicase family protein [Mechercharimyces sp. CAU 1602]MCS1350279.1 DEAD/DEAH box helicase family protein [Mechercharimyces sp. CAU 1602]
MSIFYRVKPNIMGNTQLLRPQREAYEATISHYQEFGGDEYKEILLVLPTGTGKTGLMSILPFQLSKGRVLIITPGRIIRRTVFEEFDSVNNPEKTFWYKRKVIIGRKDYPLSYLYQGYDPKKEGEQLLIKKKLEGSNIVVTNIHKVVASNEEVSLKNIIDEDFFDMIIVDEAHHVAADMWQEALTYFNVSKIIKLTGTPFRSDGQEISSNPYDPVYEFTLGNAIKEKLVKDVIRQEEIPDKLVFVHRETGEEYNLEQSKRIFGNDWVNKNVAMSEQCSKAVIQNTIKIIEEKRNSYPEHQVLAVACNDKHAQDLTKWFKQEGLDATYVSSHLGQNENEQRINDFNNGKYAVMINIQMLGEGYNNPNISIISIFRPFKTLNPYAQLIGRGLRRIREEGVSDVDNYCNVIYHAELGLNKLWEEYKYQKKYADLKGRQLSFIYEQLSLDFGELGAVEKRPDEKILLKPQDTDSDFYAYESSVNDYKSSGIGNEDSFTQEGINKYRIALQEKAIERNKQLEEKVAQYDSLLESGGLNEEEYNLLVSNAEEQGQEVYGQAFKEVHDMLMAETMRNDLAIWLNSQIDRFFQKSVLDKEGFELYNDSKMPSLSDSSPINNIGFIVKNIRQSLYYYTKKHSSLYNSKDFAFAKNRALEKFEFYLDQYGVNEEAD